MTPLQDWPLFSVNRTFLRFKVKTGNDGIVYGNQAESIEIIVTLTLLYMCCYLKKVKLVKKDLSIYKV